MKARALCLLLAAASFFLLPTSTDRIDRAASISGNQTLVSAGGVPGPTVVWVANRQSPLVNSPGVLRISADGRLVILDGRNATVWSSAAAPATATVTSRASARLRDDGNFVLRSDGDGGSVAWQSFNYPTDTLLPGMKLGVDNRAGITRNITSWSGPTDPAPGAYTFKLVTGGLPQFFLFRGPTTRIYTSGPWNGAMLTGVPHLQSQGFSFVVESGPDETYYSYSIRNGSVLSRFVVDGAAGQLQRFVWSNGAWSNFWYYPSEPCDGYAKCGPFGYCDGAQSSLCSCLPGFVPRSPDQWNLRDASGGCVRTTNLSCGGGGGGDGFWVVNRMKLPDATNATVHANMTLEQCREVCLGNCSCRAYAAADVAGGGSRGCVIWGVDLLDMRQYSTLVQDVYIRLAQSDIDALKAAEANRRRSGKTTVIAIVCAMAGVLLIAAICCCFWRTKVRRKLQSKMASSAPTGGGNGKVRKPRLDADWKCSEKDVDDLPLIDLEAILAATDNFSEENKLGEGGFGPVYLIKGKRRLLGWQKRFEIILGIARGLLYLHEDSRFRIIHRDMKASNVLLDRDMVPKISDFGIPRMFGGDQTTAYTLKVIGPYGYMSPEYAMDGLFSMKSDVYSLGVIVLEIVTGKKNRGFYDPELDLTLLGYAYMLWKGGRSAELVDEVMDGGFNHSEVLRCIQVALMCVDVQPRNRPTMSSVVMMLASENATIPEPNEPLELTLGRIQHLIRIRLMA
ncbi:hypothetical protein C2845_PM09G09830 [Panicum miliaceum]|uniref:Receptor-like serine/threonine-protein kinase n=1 Tax=Panicum miliaceum TaxID=4540 RepID=A0A3L6S1T6_PANMI|nr:hypothetical protein C2845_PM09G09830 [Panicum miliaceum]